MTQSKETILSLIDYYLIKDLVNIAVMSSMQVSRGDWLYGKVMGYDHWHEVIYKREKNNSCESGVADTSSLKICYRNKQTQATRWVNALPSTTSSPVENEVEIERVCRVYQHKPSIVIFAGSAVMYSLIAIVTSPVYLLYRAKIILARSCEYGVVGTISRLAKMLLLMVAFILANVLTIIEGSFVFHPANTVKLVSEVEKELNEGAGINEAFWSIGGPQKNYDSSKGWFYLLGCMQSNSLAILNQNNEIVGIRTYKKTTQVKLEKHAVMDTHGAFGFTLKNMPSILPNLWCPCL